MGISKKVVKGDNLCIHAGCESITVYEMDKTGDVKMEIGLEGYGGVKGVIFLSGNQLDTLIEFLKKQAKHYKENPPEKHRLLSVGDFRKI